MTARRASGDRLFVVHSDAAECSPEATGWSPVQIQVSGVEEFTVHVVAFEALGVR